MSSPCTPESINLGEDGDEIDRSTKSDRPIGRKAQKAKDQKNKDCANEGVSFKPASMVVEEYKEDRASVERKRAERFKRQFAQQ